MRDALVALNRVVSLRDPLTGKMAEVGCTPVQIHAIAALASGPLAMSELGKLLNAAGPTITGIVDRLEKLLLLERRRDDADRRVVRLHLTAEGHSLKSQFEAHIEARLARLLGLLDDNDQNTMVELFEKVATRIAAELSPAKEKSNAP